MADTKLSALTALATEPADTDEFYINDGGTSKKIAWSTIKAVFALAAQGATADTALQDVVDDTSPTLGGDLSLGGFKLLSGASNNAVIKLGDNAGTRKLSIQDSDDAEVSRIDSNGRAFFNVGGGRKAISIGDDGSDAEIKKNESGTGWLVFNSNNAAMSFSLGTNTTGALFGANTSSQEYVRIIPAINTIDLRHYTSDFTLKASHRAGDEAVHDFSIQAQEAYASATTHIVGGALRLRGGAGASGSAGNAHGGNVAIDGGQGYGTGHHGIIQFAPTRGLISFFDGAGVGQQNVPSTSPTIQNVIDALVAFGLVEQSD